MKYKIKYSILTAAALTLTACSNDDALASGQPSEPVAGEQVGFASAIGDDLELLADEDLDGTDAATRATMVDGAFGTWATTDNISVSDGTLMYTYQPKEGSISGAKCTFEAKSGKASFLTDGTGQDGTFYAFYPADAVLGWKGATVTTMIYTEQNYSENVENSGVMGPYMAAVATTTGGGANASFTFGHICSVVDVDLSTFDGGEVNAVSLYANSQVSIAGKLTYNANTKVANVYNNDATGYSYSTQSEMVRVSDIGATKPIVRFYILPTKQANGFTITVRTTDGKYYTKSSSTQVGTSEANGDYLGTLSGVNGATLCKPYYKKYKFGAISTARTQNWMAMIPGNVKFNHLSLPGTHDAATSGCTSQTAYTICQSYTIDEQLKKGARAFDLRPHTSKTSSDGSSTITHSSYSTNVSLKQALTTICSFLDSNPTEGVFVLIHEEDASNHSTTWSNNVWSTVNDFSGYIASGGWRGNLNPCRGKMVVVFRDDYTDGTNTGDIGCAKVGWGGSFSAKSMTYGNGSSSSDSYTLWYQDEYDTSSSSDKLTNLTKMLTDYIAKNETDATKTYVNNTNIAKWSLLGSTANSTLAQSVNAAVLGSSTFTAHTGKFGIMMTDFLFSSSQRGDEMFELIHQQNYKYVYKNRTRCATASTSGTDTGVDISADEYADGGTVYVKHQ